MLVEIPDDLENFAKRLDKLIEKRPIEFVNKKHAVAKLALIGLEQVEGKE